MEKIKTLIFNIFKKQILLCYTSKTLIIVEYKPIILRYNQQIDSTWLKSLPSKDKENVKNRQIEYVQREILEEVKKYINIKEVEEKEFINFNGTLIVYSK